MRHIITFHNTRSVSILLIIVIGILLYSAALFNGFVWDNIPQIVQNPDVHSFNIVRMFTSSAAFPGEAESMNYYYKPVMYIAFALVYAVSGENPFGYHLFQLVFHLGNSLLILFLFRKFYSANTSLFLSLVFLVHPLNFESAGYAASLQDTLFMFFGLGALHVYMRPAKQLFVKYILTGSFLLLSLLSKESGILFFGVLGLYSVLFEKRRQLIYLIPMTIAVAAAYTALRINSAKDIYGYLNQSAIMRLPLVNRIITVPSIFRHYMVTFILPLNLVIDQQWTVKTLSPVDTGVFVMGIGLWGYLTHRMITAKKHRMVNEWLFFSGLWWAGFIVHSHLLAPLDMTVADRWFYFPMLGLLGMVGVVLNRVKANHTVAISAALVIVGLLSMRTFARSLNWSDMMTLYSHDMPYYPDNYHLANKYAAVLLKDGDLETGERILLQGHKANPKFGAINNNLGYVYEQRNEYLRAKSHYQKAITGHDFGEAVRTYEALARLDLYSLNDPAGAKQTALDGLRTYPKSDLLKFYLAVAEYRLGNNGRAMEIAKALGRQTGSLRVAELIRAIEQGTPFNN